MESPISRLESWKIKVAAWEASGKSMNAWCRENNVTYHLLLYWREKIQGKRTLTPKAGWSIQSFTELKDKPQAASGIDIEYAGFSIRIAKRFDEGTLKRCLSTMREFKC